MMLSWLTSTLSAVSRVLRAHCGQASRWLPRLSPRKSGVVAMVANLDQRGLQRGLRNVERHAREKRADTFDNEASAEVNKSHLEQEIGARWFAKVLARAHLYLRRCRIVCPGETD